MGLARRATRDGKRCHSRARPAHRHCESRLRRKSLDTRSIDDDIGDARHLPAATQLYSVQGDARHHSRGQPAEG
jgi:hypothetical protein